ncbi:unnamed protein product [Phaedon cochleariae]|uniref:Endonuclease/exonuclease/phosphatase domain-containing protein n=1 Tax=Phaedon cochleariae TaxID=80249 RepID=A0A9P0DIN2_PHACE|nr:unnamed protein product [Phaedon cochleariae]
MPKTLKYLWCRSVAHKVDEYLSKLGPMSENNNKISDLKGEDTSTSSCGMNYNFKENHGQNTSNTGGYNIPSNTHYVPMFCDPRVGPQYARGLQGSIVMNTFPQLVMYPTYPVQNHVWNPNPNYMQYYHTNFHPGFHQPPVNINNYGAYQINSHGRYFHSNFDQRSRNQQTGTYYDEGIMSVRLWEKVIRKPSSTPGFIFTLMSYNVLAQDLLEQHPYLYQLHDQKSLNWQTRWKNILEEIKKFMPDILCLQEVQESHIEGYYSLLETLGYEGIFKKRTGKQCDGCAIYYKTDNVSLKDYSFVEYYQPIVSVLDRDNIGIVAKFAPKMHPTREFVVATTHLLFNRKRNDVRMAQMQLLLTDIEKHSYEKKHGKSLYLPVILTGDLNSSPESDLYEFITKGILKYEQLSPRLLARDPENHAGRVLVTSSLGITDNCQHTKLLEKGTNNMNIPKEKCMVDADSICKKEAKDNIFASKGTGALSHDFGFSSVYGHDTIEINEHDERRVKEGTTFQDEWLTVDYIFYSSDNGKEDKSNDMNKMPKIKLLARYRLPTTEELDTVRIPNNRLGSDHLSLTAKFKLEF